MCLLYTEVINEMIGFLLILFLFNYYGQCQDCVDSNSYCQSYARFGLCKSERNNMIKTCPKSCGFCGIQVITTTPTTTRTDTVKPTIPNKTGKPSDLSCGQSFAQTVKLINGESATKDAWPWQVSIYYKKQFLCGGSIIAPQWILTAAHCVDGFNYYYYQIVLGDYNRGFADGDEDVFYANQAFHHPNWMSPTKLNNDVALIQLNRPIMYNIHIQPVCLPGTDDVPSVGTECYVTGWGQHVIARAGPPTDVLQQEKLPIVSNDDCYNLNTNNLGIEVTNKMLCAGYGIYKEKGGCHGDSGGPFVCQSQNGRWVLQGSVSWGSGTCDSSEAFSVFARMTEFINWIQRSIEMYG